MSVHGAELQGLAAQLRLSLRGQRQRKLPELRAALGTSLLPLLSSPATARESPLCRHTQPGALLGPALTPGVNPGEVYAKEIVVKGFHQLLLKTKC